MSSLNEGYGRVKHKPEESVMKRRTPEEKQLQLKARRKAEDIKLAKELGINVEELDK